MTGRLASPTASKTKAGLLTRNSPRRARAIGARLQSLGKSGDRVLLLYGPGLDFVAGFLGCLHAGMVAIPAYPPRKNRNALRIQTISDDAEARLALTVSEMADRVENLREETPRLRELHWIATDNRSTTERRRIIAQWRSPAMAGRAAVHVRVRPGLPKASC